MSADIDVPVSSLPNVAVLLSEAAETLKRLLQLDFEVYLLIEEVNDGIGIPVDLAFDIHLDGLYMIRTDYSEEAVEFMVSAWPVWLRNDSEIRKPVYQIGVRAAERLLASIRGGQPSKGGELLRTELIVQESTGRVAALRKGMGLSISPIRG